MPVDFVNVTQLSHPECHWVVCRVTIIARVGTTWKRKPDGGNPQISCHVVLENEGGQNLQVSFVPRPGLLGGRRPRPEHVEERQEPIPDGCVHGSLSPVPTAPGVGAHGHRQGRGVVEHGAPPPTSTHARHEPRTVLHLDGTVAQEENLQNISLLRFPQSCLIVQVQKKKHSQTANLSAWPNRPNCRASETETLTAEGQPKH
jgi:hypothetical protein